MFRLIQIAASVLALCATAGVAAAQGAQVGFGSDTHDRSAPIEVTAENLDVNQKDGTAVFTGDVLIAQGEMRLSAPRVLVVYLEDRSGIKRLQASGGVTLVSGEDAAEGAEADYDVEQGRIEMSGDVLLVQGDNVLSGDRMFVDTAAGTARMSGRVKTVLQPGTTE